MSKKQAIGGRILAAREAKGLSLLQAARRLGVSPLTLRRWEQGREDIDMADRQTMAVVYGTSPQYLVPERPAVLERDEACAVIRIGSVAFTLDGSDDQTLRRFLAAVREERGVDPDVPLRVRESDAAFLADLLGGSADAIASTLRRLLGLTDGEADEFSRSLFGRTAVGAVMTMNLTTDGESAEM